MSGPERGPTGDHGQDGRDGRDAPTVLSRLQVLTLIGFVVACFLVLALRTEGNSRDTRHAVTVACERANMNTRTINEFLDVQIENTKASPVLTKPQIAQRVASYKATKQPPIKC